MLITRKRILILGDRSTQGLDGTKLTAEKLYSINFTKNNKKFCLNLHYNGANTVVYLLMVKKLLNLKQMILRLQQLHYV